MIEIIDEKLGNGKIIVAEAEAAGLEVALACALVEQESSGKNIFGCDHGDVGDKPPYCRQKVTKSRVQKLRAGGDYPHGMNGVGITQLTWYEFVEQAEDLGGAHLPENQCRIGFGLLKSYVDKYPLLEAMGAYNAGESNRLSVLDTYAAQLHEKYDAWKALLPAKYPEILLAEKEGTWLGEEDGNRWARTKPNLDLKSNSRGWIYVPQAEIVTPDDWDWPQAWDTAIPGSDWYVERHPTRYHWSYGGRHDVDAWARWLVNNYDVSCNTYVDHPEGWARDYDSLDVWGKAGRGYGIDKDLGDEIHAILFNDPNLPNINWIIWQGWMWTAAGGWEWFSSDTSGTDMGHFKHIHITYK